MVRARLRWLWTAHRRAKAKPERYPNCQVCGTGVTKTLSHLLLRCPVWAAQRADLLGDAIREARRALGRRLAV